MSDLSIWLTSVDPVTAFLFVLPFGIGVLGLIAEALRPEHSAAGERKSRAKLVSSDGHASRLTAGRG